MPFNGGDIASCRNIPQSDRAIKRSRSEDRSIERERHGLDGP